MYPIDMKITPRTAIWIAARKSACIVRCKKGHLRRALREDGASCAVYRVSNEGQGTSAATPAAVRRWRWSGTEGSRHGDGRGMWRSGGGFCTASRVNRPT
ncbi:hypothetical protein [Cohnella fermenti]|uniref:Uncharacterized protein n=1 Tax=Cohnella fermenti TaxID=2565925 RepID=A0A4S4C9V0_9BACL|nr:hypothetical protein [Cohnella fermenti]THF84156.1 hypothetical protein E6C55_02320 [Cohnella fermenti]